MAQQGDQLPEWAKNWKPQQSAYGRGGGFMRGSRGGPQGGFGGFGGAAAFRGPARPSFPQPLRQGTQAVKQEATAPPQHTYGFRPHNEFKDKYAEQGDLGKGAFGKVFKVTDKVSGKICACKRIPKQRPAESCVDGPPSAAQQARYIMGVYLEVDALRRLRGALNVVYFEEAYEDAESVYLVTELCTGGPIWEPGSGTDPKNFTEEQVARFMRDVLRVIAQCHSKQLLHRDIKPGNFLLASKHRDAPLKAIDLGLAAPFVPGKPREDLGLDGTPYYIAPEVLRSETWPQSDVWQAGVMAYQLLTGRLPFSDRGASGKGSVAALFSAILNDDIEAKLDGPEMAAASATARDFVRTLLQRDIHARPSAVECLSHPFLSRPEHGTQRPLGAQVVTRLQRFCQAPAFKRTVLVRVARELMGLADDVAAPAGAVPERPEARRPREGSQDSMEGSRHSHRSRTSDRSDHFPTGRMSVDLARPAAAHEVGGKRERGEEASATAEGDRERLLRRTTSSGRRVSLDLGLVGPPRQEGEGVMPGGFVELPLEGRSMDGGERGGGEEEAGGGEGERRGAGGQKDAMSLLKGIRELFGQMDVDADGKVSLRELREGLRRQRYLLTKEEAQHMLEAMDVDADGNISFPAFVAAIIDWRALEGTAEWMSATQRVFKSLDQEGQGALGLSSILSTLQASLPPDEIRSAVADALMDAGVVDTVEYYSRPTVDESIRAGNFFARGRSYRDRDASLEAIPEKVSQARAEGNPQQAPEGRTLAPGLGRLTSRRMDFGQFITMLKSENIVDSSILSAYPTRLRQSSSENASDPFEGSMHSFDRLSIPGSSRHGPVGSPFIGGSRHGPVGSPFIGGSRHGPVGSPFIGGSRHGPGGSRHGGSVLSDLMRASLSMPRGSVAPVDSVGGSLHRGGGSHRGGGAYAALATGRTDSAAALAPVPERGLAEGMHRGALGVRTSGGPVLLGAGTDGGLKGADVSAAHLHAARVPSPDPAKSALSEKLARVGPEAGAAEEDGAGAGGAGAGAGRVASLGPSAEAAARERQGAARLDRRSGRMRIAGPKGATVIETGKESLGEVGPVGASAAARSGAVAGAVGPGELGGACGGEAGGKGGGERETHGGVLFKMLMGEQRQDDVQEG